MLSLAGPRSCAHDQPRTASPSAVFLLRPANIQLWGSREFRAARAWSPGPCLAPRRQGAKKFSRRSGRGRGVTDAPTHIGSNQQRPIRPRFPFVSSVAFHPSPSLGHPLPSLALSVRGPRRRSLRFMGSRIGDESAANLVANFAGKSRAPVRGWLEQSAPKLQVNTISASALDCQRFLV